MLCGKCKYLKAGNKQVNCLKKHQIFLLSKEDGVYACNSKNKVCIDSKIDNKKEKVIINIIGICFYWEEIDEAYDPPYKSYGEYDYKFGSPEFKMITNNADVGKDRMKHMDLLHDKITALSKSEKKMQNDK